MTTATGQLLAEHPLLFAWLAFVIGARTIAPSAESLPKAAHDVYTAAMVTGAMWISLTALWRLMTLVATGLHREVALYVFERLVMLAAGLLLIRINASYIIDCLAWAKAHPDAMLAAAAGAVVVVGMFSLAPRRLPAGTAITYGAEPYERGISKASMVAARQRRAAEEIRRTAIHEAGHLLYFADLPELPADLSVRVLEEIGPTDEFRGQVWHGGNWPAVQTEHFPHWSMLMRLAGSEAEYVLLGDRADGSNGDNANWLRAAVTFLDSGFGEVYYPDAHIPAEREHNRAVLNTLKAAHVDEVRARLSRNREVLTELADAILEHKTMSREEIAPYLARVSS